MVGCFVAEVRVRENLDRYLESYRLRVNQTDAPCVTLYKTFLNWSRHFHQWFRTPPVVNEICALYSCITPPNSAIALAHQANIIEDPKFYQHPNTPLVAEFRSIMQELFDDQRTFLNYDFLRHRFRLLNGHDQITDVETNLHFCISDQTFRVFNEWNKEVPIVQLLSRL